jgi:Rap1a immunity proteins
MKTILVVTIALALLTGSAHGWKDINDWLDSCYPSERGKQIDDPAYCIAYFAGAYEALPPRTVCVPDGPLDVRALVTRWVRNNPEYRHDKPAWVFQRALISAHPCKR